MPTDPTRPLWLAPMWLREDLKEARTRLGAVKRAHERLHDTTTDYARSMAVTARVRAKVVEMLETELAAVEAEEASHRG